ncbi:hypothetical protein E5F05_01970 (plasmid) [Deinococcus metallilatus]|uniref:Uncharacterized protein n=1 Tax=Deinococcus metallilatus TaxID=1211322 RepID=A0ABR6MVW3_9DEIO|nr:hypothetical protein [Deinococcus metallilatus]MBB5295839.1 hypothetical protein [Deinococcus metallilatus]QBY06736.1 hypothetical protein E5F05_01970 [Deinococcus metallilatus]GMA14365.1 hypothetical protein GCM10025871_06960 [Deinococcus metallilatus]
MKRLALLGVLLVGCVPRGTAPSVTFTPLGEADYRALIAPFGSALGEAGITVTRASVYGYSGSQAEAFDVATRDFYRRYPGFCPVQGGVPARE